MLVYQQDKRPVKIQSWRITALRCLEAALRSMNRDSRPTATDAQVLDNAVDLAKGQLSARAAYSVAGQLELLADLMVSMRFISVRQRWRHALKKPSDTSSRISKEALEARQKKLPSAATLRALGGIFFEAREPGDVVVSSFTALMLCAPERVNEVLRLRRNCIVAGDGEFTGRVGLRWSGSKGFDNTTKWLPSEMAPIAQEAVGNLLSVTASAHALAAWYTANPKKLYLHEAAKHLRAQEVLTTSDVALILWGDGDLHIEANTWIKKAKIPKFPLPKRRVGVLFEDLERAVLAMLPATFPCVPGSPDLKCVDSMALVRVFEMSAVNRTYLCMFSVVDYHRLTKDFGAGERHRFSIFERYGYKEDDGSNIELRSHSLRHYLNMLAQVGGLSSAEIALFSGRRNVQQNRDYDHMSSDEVQAPISRALKDGFTSELELPEINLGSLVTRAEFRGLGLAAAHTTEYGWCSHDFASEPCQMYRDCMNCEEQECIKGEAHKEANLRSLKKETTYLLGQAREALSDDEYGADAWVAHQTKTLERIEALLRILEDPAVPDGARIRLDISNAPVITADNVHGINVVGRARKKVLP
jgi:hypothetical protein